MSIEIDTQVGFKAVNVSEYWIEWICRDTIEVEESNQLAVFLSSYLQPTSRPQISEALQSIVPSTSQAEFSSP